MEQLTQHDPRRIGQFEVLGRLGAGGMGLVYLARSASGRRVAIKTVRSELAEDQLFRVRFTREVEAARAVSGFYTAAVVDADPGAAVPWLATAYVPAPSLEEIVAECGPLPAQAVRWLAAGIAEALQSIHGAGLVHRDLKPSNVLVVEDGPRVIDFGIASGVSNTRLTMTNVAVGTPAYMSPEQARDSRSVSGASDVFSLASTMVFAATGHPPYRGANPVETVFMLLRERPDLTGLPDELRPLIESLMEHKADDRPTPAELQADLAPHLFAASDDSGTASAWLPQGAVEMIERRRGGVPSRPPEQDRRKAPPPVPPQAPGPRPPAPPLPPPSSPPYSAAVSRPPGPASSPSPSPAHASAPRPGADVLPPPTGDPVRLPGVRMPIGPGPHRGEPSGPGDHLVPHSPDWARPPTGAPGAAVSHPSTAHQGQTTPPRRVAPARWRPWRFRMNHELWGSPTVRGGLLYVTSHEVHALDVASGRRQFKSREPAWALAVTGGRVLASDGSALYALDATDGSGRWRIPAEGWIYGLRADRGTLVTATRGGGVQAWESANGERLWELSGVQTDFESPDTAPVVHGGTVYVWGEGLLYALEARTGAEQWRYPVGDVAATGGVPVRVAPSEDGAVHVSAGSRVLALDAATGAERWRFDAPAAILSPPAYESARSRAAGVYFADYLGTVYALDVATGDDRWRIATEGRQTTEPVVVADGLVHLGSGAAMYTLDAVSGTPRWRFAAGESIVGSPVVRDGRLHFGSADHCLYTLDAVSGRLSWKLETGGEITGTPAASDGMVFACSKDHCVYALDAARGTRQS
ncbi:PQQ-binding-like beta-propeller repeat protein [Streptomyces avicenniae]|uniref:outer membrane protein assembly factor BamB family protein n=1 Tax=Streptomyces avicenniae TaxID=500153 RepID=UPI000699E5E7|nr:PQQ-binding-like beta-propeller repeat protein [Streptomyces avicenniae]